MFMQVGLFMITCTGRQPQVKRFPSLEELVFAFELSFVVLPLCLPSASPEPGVFTGIRAEKAPR